MSHYKLQTGQPVIQLKGLNSKRKKTKAYLKSSIALVHISEH